MLAFGVLGLPVLPTTGLAQSSFKRGDLDGDGCVGGTDFAQLQQAFGADITTLGVPCESAYDINDDGLVSVTLADIAAFIQAVGQFQNLPAPGGETCGTDPTPDALTCTAYSGCAGACEESACVSTDVSGTIQLPPEGVNCRYLSAEDLHMIIDGLPPGSDIEVDVIHKDFINNTSTPGGTFPGGTIEEFNSTVRLEMKGNGALAGFERVIDLDAPTEVHSAAPYPANGADDQIVQSDMRDLQGGITAGDGDPDFESLTVTAGTANALSSPGGAILEQLGGEFDVDSSFSVNYRIDFVGAAGGELDGLSGSTSGTALMALPEHQPGVPALSAWGYPALIGAMFGVAVLAVATRRLRSDRS